MPPFAPGALITEIHPDHRLIFNKFYVVKKHLLLVTRNFEP